MIKNILVYTLVPSLLVAVVVLTWAINKIKMVKKSYETRIEVPVEDLMALHRTITSVYQLSLNLNNPENKQAFLSKTIELYKLNSKLVQNYLKFVKEEKAYKMLNKVQSGIDKDTNSAQEVLEKIKLLQKGK